MFIWKVLLHSFPGTLVLFVFFGGLSPLECSVLYFPLQFHCRTESVGRTVKENIVLGLNFFCWGVFVKQHFQLKLAYCHYCFYK